MPVFFYIDPEFDEDCDLLMVDEITLSYTFFESKHSEEHELMPSDSNVDKSTAYNT